MDSRPRLWDEGGMRAVLLLVLLTAALSSGCPSYSTIPDDQRKQIEDGHTGELLFFRQSMYVGQFYDDDRFRLVHGRRFEELTYLQTVEGDAIPPGPAEGIIPAGTRVRVERIEWPLGETVFRRPLYTPRYTTWVWLRVAADRGPEVTVEREQRHILLLPAGINDAEGFDLWFDASLSAEDPSPWLLSLPKEQQNGIALKRAVAGMDYDALTAALGFPDSITRDLVEGSTREVAIFGATSVVLKDGIVERVSDPAASGG
jgi:hypothetical protein